MTTRTLRTLLNLSLTAASLLVHAPGALAQRPGVPLRPGAGFRPQATAPQLALLQLPNVLLTRLKVTPEQKQALEAVRARKATDLQASPAHREAGADPRGTYLRMQALERQSEAEALSVLSTEQRRAFSQMQADYRLLAGLGRPALALLNVTGLTADQKRDLQALIREIPGKQREALRKLDRSASLQQQREALQGVEKETEKTVQEKLTPRQGKEFVVALSEVPAHGRYRAALPSR